MKPRFNAGSRLARTLLVVAIAAPLGACDDSVSPFRLWSDRPDSASLYSLDRVDNIGQPGAYDFLNRRTIVVEAQGSFEDWDIAITEMDGEFHLLPAGAVNGFTITPGIAIDSSGTVFELVDRAPRDTASYATRTAVPLDTSVVYIIRTRRNPIYGCLQYGKLEVLAVDEATGVVEVRAVTNPNCSDRALVPPDPT